MKRLLYSLSGLGLVSILVMGTSVSGSSADQARSPLRGTWSFSQFNPSTTLLTPPNPIPITAVGTLVMDENNRFTGHGVFNTPVEGLQTVELDLDGHCTVRNGDISNGADCLFNFHNSDETFVLKDVGRFCVVMANGKGQCFDEFRCVDTNEPGGTVLLVEYKRQHLGTCK